MPALHSPALRCDILIVGGGLAGSAAAYYLAREGSEVAVVERFDPNTQASGSNAGSLHAQIPHDEFVNEGEAWARNFAPTIRLLVESIRVWQGLEAELGADLEVSVEGGVLLAGSEAEADAVRRKITIEHEHGLAVEWIDRAGLDNIAPYAAPGMVGAAFCPTEGKANPLKATPAYIRAAEKHGARFLTRRNVTNVTAAAGGYRVETSAGPIQARCVVNSAGAEAGRIAGFLGIDLPIEGHPIQVNVTEPVAPFVPHLVYSAGKKLTLKQAKNGSLLIGGGWPARWSSAAERPAVDLASLRGNLATAMAVVPQVASARLLRVWPAIVNGTADWRPILGEVPGLPGFFMNFFPWMGFTAGPLCAQITAALVLGREPPVDISGFTANLKRA
jgi:sarcosine oxidase subunit beta